MCYSSLLLPINGAISQIEDTETSCKFDLVYPKDADSIHETNVIQILHVTELEYPKNATAETTPISFSGAFLVPLVNVEFEHPPITNSTKSFYNQNALEFRRFFTKNCALVWARVSIDKKFQWSDFKLIHSMEQCHLAKIHHFTVLFNPLERFLTAIHKIKFFQLPFGLYEDPWPKTYTNELFGSQSPVTLLKETVVNKTVEFVKVEKEDVSYNEWLFLLRTNKKAFLVKIDDVIVSEYSRDIADTKSSVAIQSAALKFLRDCTHEFVPSWKILEKKNVQLPEKYDFDYLEFWIETDKSKIKLGEGSDELFRHNTSPMKIIISHGNGGYVGMGVKFEVTRKFQVFELNDDYLPKDSCITYCMNNEVLENDIVNQCLLTMRIGEASLFYFQKKFSKKKIINAFFVMIIIEEEPTIKYYMPKIMENAYIQISIDEHEEMAMRFHEMGLYKLALDLYMEMAIQMEKQLSQKKDDRLLIDSKLTKLKIDYMLSRLNARLIYNKKVAPYISTHMDDGIIPMVREVLQRNPRLKNAYRLLVIALLKDFRAIEAMSYYEKVCRDKSSLEYLKKIHNEKKYDEIICKILGY